MTTTTLHTCPFCNTIGTSSLRESVALFCKSCGEKVYDRSRAPIKAKSSRMPADWSFIQLRTTGEFEGQSFTIVGRIRLQLRNDYKNFWCAALSNGDALWLMESFASFSVLPAIWNTYNGQVSNLRSDRVFNVRKGLKLTGEFVEKCEEIAFEGEIGSWKWFQHGFFFIQAANREGEIAVFTIFGKNDVEFLSGKKVDWEKLSLKNTIQWDEWK